VADLLAQLDLETLEEYLFRGGSRNLGGRSVFGGQVAGQAIVAAARTVESGRPAHSLHGYFLRPGDMAQDIVYEVDPVRNGRSFATRRVQAIQHGRAIFTLIASFHIAESGYTHQMPMPDVPGPEGLASYATLRWQWLDEHPDVPERVRKSASHETAIETRPITPWNSLAPEKREARQQLWFKAKASLPEDPGMHRAVLTYATDFNLLLTSLFPHGVSFFTPGMQMASLDHALWFHREPKADDWLLYTMDSPAAQGARGFARGLIFNRAGELVASVAQEGLIRLHDETGD
jgi:acyl-CoA thioesterase-2